ncbi:hypothetical protein PS627_04538 [Pseudomonas fluorescens]|uniref:hypothetical protein n=1 Tax=Pseudomonas fluorescens TaxID=294 RepID=UPI00125467D7|nr:hypothetical protein [Pseudomonas fluorescens]CAG8871585.1 hypothetical protein PS627_04538 [Pseudomonas fluorescens]
MLKIVPDPPLSGFIKSPQSLEDTLVQASEYLVCAQTVAQQAVQQLTKPGDQVLTLAVMHEIDAAHSLVELALGQVQARHSAQGEG